MPAFYYERARRTADLPDLRSGTSARRSKDSEGVPVCRRVHHHHCSVLVHAIERPTATNGNLYLEGGQFGGSYEFDLQGGAHRQPNGTTVAWRPTSSDAWSVTRMRKDEVVDSTDVFLRGDTLRTSLRGKLPDGSPYERITRWRRQGHGSGLIGTWHSIKVDTGSTFDEFVISTAENGVVTWRIPTDLQVITGRLDGSDLPIIGPTGPSGSTIALLPVGHGRFQYAIKRANRVTERGTITISSDGRWLTEMSWAVEQPDRKSRLV